MIIGRNPKRTLIRCLFLAVGTYLIAGHVIRPVRVQGISMEPTLHNRTIHAVNLLAYWTKEPKRGDLVAVAMPGGQAYFMKRVLGLPGETVAFEQGTLMINGNRFEEPYLTDRGQWTMPPRLVPDGSYFIAGDNRSTSFEGHTLGFVERNHIVGALWK